MLIRKINASIWSRWMKKKTSSLIEDKRKDKAQRAPALKPGRVIRVTFSPGHPGLTWFTIYPGLTRIGSREKRNCSFDDMETYKRYRVALS